MAKLMVGRPADHNIGTDALWAGCYLFDIENMATAYKSFCMDATVGVTMTYTQHTAYSPTAAMESMWGTYYDDVIGDRPDGRRVPVGYVGTGSRNRHTR